MGSEVDIRINTIIEIEELIHECLTWRPEISSNPQQANRELKREILFRIGELKRKKQI